VFYIYMEHLQEMLSRRRAAHVAFERPHESGGASAPARR